jgi:hypothetical protein
MSRQIPEWYAEWVRNHLTTFGLHTAEGTPEMYIAWWPSFYALDATAAELADATTMILRGGPAPARTADHYQAVKRAIAELRNNRNQRATLARYSNPDDRGQCVQCVGSGIVAVPHPDHCSFEGWRPSHYSASGNPVYVTAAVLCNCERGRAIAARQAGIESEKGASRPRQLTLEQYAERINPNWREQLADRAKQQEMIRETESGMPTAAELAGRFAMPRRAG